MWCRPFNCLGASDYAWLVPVVLFLGRPTMDTFAPNALVQRGLSSSNGILFSPQLVCGATTVWLILGLPFGCSSLCGYAPRKGPCWYATMLLVPIRMVRLWHDYWSIMVHNALWPSQRLIEGVPLVEVTCFFGYALS